MKKRILVLMLALTIPFSVMGCGKEEKVSISDSVEATDSGSVEKEQTEEVDNSLESTETVSDENIEEMPEAEALHTTGSNGSRYANAHPRTGCRIHETSADMRSLRHRRAVPCVPSRCGHVPAYPCSKSPCVPLLSFSLPR